MSGDVLTGQRGKRIILAVSRPLPPYPAPGPSNAVPRFQNFLRGAVVSVPANVRPEIDLSA
jgi:hypothetical protein